MATLGSTLPELDERMRHEREEWEKAAVALRTRLRRDLNPKLQLRQAVTLHPLGAAVAAMLAGWSAGRALSHLLH